jgi:hypothetical protein
VSVSLFGRKGEGKVAFGVVVVVVCGSTGYGKRDVSFDALNDLVSSVSGVSLCYGVMSYIRDFTCMLRVIWKFVSCLVCKYGFAPACSYFVCVVIWKHCCRVTNNHRAKPPDAEGSITNSCLRVVCKVFESFLASRGR